MNVPSTANQNQELGTRQVGEPYRYNELEQEDAIRLIDLTSMRNRSELTRLSCKIIDNYDVVEDKRYIALSYTWESPEIPENPVRDSRTPYYLDVNGKQLEVQENLYRALQAIVKTTRTHQSSVTFRALKSAYRGFQKVGGWLGKSQSKDEDLERYLDTDFGWHIWADAVCINQKNMTERSCQVLRMRKTYEYADEVLIWLGPSDKHSVKAIKLIKAFRNAEDRIKVEPESVSIPTSSSQYTNSSIFKLINTHAFSSADFDSIFHFLSRPWFNRLWIIQEVAAQKYASQVKMLCGDDTIHWYAVRDFISLGVKQGWFQYTIAMRNFAGQPQLNFGAALIEGMTEIAQYGHQPWFHISKYIEDIFSAADYDAMGANTLAWLSYLCRDRQASDKRDVIFASMSMVNTWPASPPRPNYALGTDEIFTTFTKWMMEQAPGFMPLSFVDDGGNRTDNETGLPSWVQNFAVARRITPIASVRLSNVWSNSREDKDTNQAFDFPTMKQLRLRGFKLDTIELLSHPLNSVYGICWIDNLALVSKPWDARYMNGQYRLEALLRTLVADYPKHMSTYGQPENFAPGVPKSASELDKYAAAQRHMETSSVEWLKFAVAYSSMYFKLPYPSTQDWWEHRPGLIKICEDVAICPSKSEFDDYREKFSKAWEPFKGINEQKIEVWKSFVEPMSPFREEALGLGNSRRLVCTKSRKLLGLAPDSVHADDEIWILKDARVPFILRPKVLGNYELIGEAYIHGVMNGDNLTHAAPSELSTVILE